LRTRHVGKITRAIDAHMRPLEEVALKRLG
jgi:hypothetical protein